MLSEFFYSKFRETMQSRCAKRGIQLIQVNPAYSSVIGMCKFMGRMGLNSGTAAAFVLARRALKFSERLPKCLARPEDGVKHCWSAWNRVARGIKGSKKHKRVHRHALFGWKRFPEVIPALFEKPKAKASKPSRARKAASSASQTVPPSENVRLQAELPMLPEPVQLSLFDRF